MHAERFSLQPVVVGALASLIIKQKFCLVVAGGEKRIKNLINLFLWLLCEGCLINLFQSCLLSTNS